MHFPVPHIQRLTVGSNFNHFDISGRHIYRIR